MCGTSPPAGTQPSTTLATQTIEVDQDLQGDEYAESAYSDGASSATTSLASSVLRYRMENGRTYHSYQEGKYAIPNDDTENNRLDLQHALFNLTTDGKLYLAPVKEVHNCLDIGTGTGIWAIDFADEHPETQVTAVDLSPIQPTMVPPNVKFLIDDIEEEWVYDQSHFDYIHSRQMVGSIQDWSKLLSRCFAHLRPGGWVELQDVSTLNCDDDSMTKDSAVKQWWDLVGEAFDKLGRPMITADKHKQRLVDAGFVDVQEIVYKWPINTWPKDKKLKEMGLWSRENTLEALEAVAIAPLTRALGWSPEEVQVLVAKARQDIMNPRIHAYFRMHFVYGRKPDENE